EFIGSGGGGNTVQEETFYCKDIYNTSSGKTYLVPARTDRELLSFIDVANQAVLDGLSTKVLSGESGYDWYTKVIKDIRYPDTCERKLYGDTSTFEQGYWKGTIYCPSLPCDTSKTITASRRCFRSTGIEEDCQSCLSKYPDMYVPSPVSPAGNIHTGNKGKCVFQRTCYGPPCPPPPAPSGGGDGSGSGSGSGSSGWGSDWATSMTSWANSFSGTTGRTYDYSCFPPKTPITMADGSAKPIFDIKVGDMVMGFKIGSDAPLKPAKVESLSIRDAEYVKINNLEVTPEHPMQLADGKIVSVSQLNIGDKISKADGSIEEVKTIQSKAGSARVFNLYLEDADGFIADGIRVLDGKHVK
ncbi:MAG: Hint domain-containing protein, partial [Alphaproteobacteria bacterium]|nr:Hint domain-containing protein [Alphaproteobacteria bacterium]